MLENPYYHDEEAKVERGVLRKVIAVLGALCLIVLLAIAATWPTKAHADTRKYENRMATVRFLDSPCEIDVPEKAKLRAAHGSFTMMARTPYGMYPLGRQDFKGCWKLVEDGYESVWEDGQSITFPAAEVRPEGV